jgi:hypothetical protein
MRLHPLCFGPKAQVIAAPLPPCPAMARNCFDDGYGPFYRAVDHCVMRGVAWPDNGPEQDAFLLSISPSSWTLRLHRTYMDHALHQVASKTLDTPWGERWFDVWQEQAGHRLCVVKQPAPKRPLTVTCSLDVDGQSIQATFRFLSGRVLATEAFRHSFPHDPLLLEDLEQAAALQAFKQGLLETRYQEASCQLYGFACKLPSGLLIWHQDTITLEGLQEWLAYLRTLSENELQRWDFYLMDIAISCSESTHESLETLDQDFEIDPCSSSCSFDIECACDSDDLSD